MKNNRKGKYVIKMNKHYYANKIYFLCFIYVELKFMIIDVQKKMWVKKRVKCF